MSEFLLTDEEIHKAYFESRGRYDSDARKAIAKAQLKKLVGWLELNFRPYGIVSASGDKLLPNGKWQALLKSIGGDNCGKD